MLRRSVTEERSSRSLLIDDRSEVRVDTSRSLVIEDRSNLLVSSSVFGKSRSLGNSEVPDVREDRSRADSILGRSSSLVRLLVDGKSIGAKDISRCLKEPRGVVLTCDGNCDEERAGTDCGTHFQCGDR